MNSSPSHFVRCRECGGAADGETGGRGLEVPGLRLGEQEQDQDVRARGGQARGHGRLQLPPLWQVLSLTKVSEESQIYESQKLWPNAILIKEILQTIFVL